MADRSRLDTRITNLEKRLNVELESWAEQAIYLFHAYVEEHFNEGKRPGVFSKSDKLYVNSGRLTQSFVPQRFGSLAGVEVTSNGLRIRLGTDIIYARIHEYGGFIPSRGRMHRYFWAKYYETRDKSYKIIALSVMRKGGVDMPARPFFNPAVKVFRVEGREQLLKQLSRIIETAFRQA